MKKIHVAAAVIYRQQGKSKEIFATARGYGEHKGMWEFPGGKLEAGETAQEALVREIQEELDATIAVEAYLDTIDYDYPAFHLQMDCFLCRIIQGSPVLKEAADALWLNADTLMDVNWLPADKALLPKVEAYLRSVSG